MTTRVDFYQLSRDPVDVTVAKLARKVLQSGKRLLVVSGSAEQREGLSKTLWEQGGAAFLANGMADAAHANRQPVLLSDRCDPANGAKLAIIADGKWREEASDFGRVLLLFDPDGRDAARELWRRLDPDEAFDNRIFKQTEQGGWREGR